MSVLLVTLLALVFGLGLGYVALRFRVEGDPVVEQIDAILPQTQCGQCGFPGCRPYAEAIARDDAQINQCPPGGEAGMRALADLLGRDPVPLAEEHAGGDDDAEVARINDDTCIGCTKCIQICPVDAIVGAPKQRHTVLDRYCTGCELCLPPLCPVSDCIIMRPRKKSVRDWGWSAPLRIGGGRAA